MAENKLRVFFMFLICMIVFSSANNVFAANFGDVVDTGSSGVSSVHTGSPIVNSLVLAGDTLAKVAGNSSVLYLIYLFSFFFVSYTLIHLGLNKLDQFKGKPAKVVAIMVSVMGVGGIFYNKSTAALVTLFNGFGGFIVLLFVAGSLVATGIFLFLKYKEKNMKIAVLALTFFLYVGTAVILPSFFVYDKTQGGYVEGGFIGDLFDGNVKNNPFMIFGSIFNLVNEISLFAMLISLIMVIFDLFGEKDENGKSTRKSNKNTEEKKREKDLKTVRSLLGAIGRDLRATNNHFNNKVNILNDIRRQIGNLRDEREVE